MVSLRPMTKNFTINFLILANKAKHLHSLKILRRNFITLYLKIYFLSLFTDYFKYDL